jgi:hypothetical protein
MENVTMRDVRNALIKLAPKNREPILLWTSAQESLIESLTEERDVLRGLLERAQEFVCSMDCPSTGRAGTPIPHRDLCKAITWALLGTADFAATLAHGTEPSDSEPKASSTGEDGRSQEEAADGGKAVMEGE